MLNWIHRGCSLLRYLLKSFLDNFVSTCSTVQPYVLALELDALPLYLKAGAADGSLCINTIRITFEKLAIELLPLLRLQFARVLIARTGIAEDCLLNWSQFNSFILSNIFIFRLNWSQRGCSLLRYSLKYFLDIFVFTCPTVQPYISAVELDASHCISKLALLTVASVSTLSASLLKTAH